MVTLNDCYMCKKYKDNIQYHAVWSYSLVKKVMMYRGPNRNKGEHGAAAWFLRPVTDDEAPGYSAIISKPMDFGTVKKKLEVCSLFLLMVFIVCCMYWNFYMRFVIDSPIRQLGGVPW